MDLADIVSDAVNGLARTHHDCPGRQVGMLKTLGRNQDGKACMG
jgi:hypothetical protein